MSICDRHDCELDVSEGRLYFSLNLTVGHLWEDLTHALYALLHGDLLRLKVLQDVAQLVHLGRVDLACVLLLIASKVAEGLPEYV